MNNINASQLLTQLIQKIDPSVSNINQVSAQLLQKLQTSYSLSESDMNQLLQQLIQILQKLFPNLMSDADQLLTQIIQLLEEDIYNPYFLSDGKGRGFSGGDGGNGNLSWFYNAVKDEAPWTLDYNAAAPFNKEGGASLKLYARYLAQPTYSNKTVIACHGMDNNSLNMGNFARVFYDLGYNILAPDARGYGLSQDPNRNLGILDSDDIASWVNAVVAKDPKAEIVLFGGSMGASTILEASYKNQSSAVRSIIEDCGHSQLNKFMLYAMKNNDTLSKLNDLELIAILLAFDVLLYSKQGVLLIEGLTEAGLATTTLPILTIHGTADTGIPPQNASVISSLVNNNDNLKYQSRYFCEGAPHYESVNTNRTEYINYVKSFLQLVEENYGSRPAVFRVVNKTSNVTRSTGTVSFTANIIGEFINSAGSEPLGSFDIIVSPETTLLTTIVAPAMEFKTDQSGNCNITVSFPTDPLSLSVLQNSTVTVRRIYQGQQNAVTIGLLK